MLQNKMVIFTVMLIPIAWVYSVYEADIGLETYSTLISLEQYQADRCIS